MAWPPSNPALWFDPSGEANDVNLADGPAPFNAKFWAGDGEMGITSGSIYSTETSGTSANAGKTDSSFTDEPIIIEVDAAGTGANRNINIYFRAVGVGPSAGYYLAIDNNVDWFISEIDGGETRGSGTSAALAAGDKVGIELNGTSIITHHWDASAGGGSGAWAQITTGTGASSSSTGYFGIESEDATARWGAIYIGEEAGPEPTIVAGTMLGAFSGTTVTPVIPTHAADDILVAQGLMNVASDLTLSGWTAIVTAENNANLSTGWWWKRATSGAESNPVITSSATATATDGLYGRAYVISNAATSGDPFEDATLNGSPTSSTTPAGATIDTTDDDRLVVTFASIDAAGAYASGLPPGGWTTADDDGVAY